MRWVNHGTDEYAAMIDLRERVLRLPLGMKIDRAHLGIETNAKHLSAWTEGQCVGTMVMTDEGKQVCRMRAVAVEPSRQGSGVGRQMITEFERKAREMGYTDITLNARMVAVPFYLINGYQIVSEEFIEVTIPHVTMRKRL